MCSHRLAAVAATAFVVSFTAALGVAGLMLKHEHKTKPVTYGVSNGCYTWSDGHSSCRELRAPMTEAERHYGCRFVDADEHGGECP